jgi:multisubunit Na+/H+ antiporter MnhF subunit
MTAQAITQFAVYFGLFVLSVAFLLTVWRVIRGRTLPDRVIALDMLVGIVMGFIALIAIRTGYTLYIDIAISLGLVGFLATVALARFILSRKRREGEDGSPPEPLSQRSASDTDQQPAPSASLPAAPAVPDAPATAPAGTVMPAAAPAIVPGAPPAAPKPAPSKSEVTKASAAKVKIAKAKARGKAAGAAETAASGSAAAVARPKPPSKPAAKPVARPAAKPPAKKETP